MPGEGEGQRGSEVGFCWKAEGWGASWWCVCKHRHAALQVERRQQASCTSHAQGWSMLRRRKGRARPLQPEQPGSSARHAGAVFSSPLSSPADLLPQKNHFMSSSCPLRLVSKSTSFLFYWRAAHQRRSSPATFLPQGCFTDWSLKMQP